MRPHTRLAFLALLAVTACDGLFGPKAGDANRAELRAQLVLKQSEWQARALKNYDYNYQFACECDSAFSKPVRILVRAGNVNMVTDTLGTEIPLSTNAHWPTVDSLYKWAFFIVDNKQYGVGLAYNDTLDYVTYLAGDPPFGSTFIHLAEKLVVK